MECKNVNRYPDSKLNEYGLNLQQQYLSAGDDERLSELVCHLQSVMDRVSLLAISKANGARGKLKDQFNIGDSFGRGQLGIRLFYLKNLMIQFEDI